MELFEAIGARRSIRAYTDEAVPEEKIMQILEAGRLAPSWKNWQCWKFILVSDKELRLKLGEAVNNNPNALTYQNAPYFIVVCGDPEQSGIVRARITSQSSERRKVHRTYGSTGRIKDYAVAQYRTYFL